jgi:hypothetical protein
MGKVIVGLAGLALAAGGAVTGLAVANGGSSEQAAAARTTLDQQKLGKEISAALQAGGNRIVAAYAHSPVYGAQLTPDGKYSVVTGPDGSAIYTPSQKPGRPASILWASWNTGHSSADGQPGITGIALTAPGGAQEAAASNIIGDASSLYGESGFGAEETLPESSAFPGGTIGSDETPGGINYADRQAMVRQVLSDARTTPPFSFSEQ